MTATLVVLLSMMGVVNAKRWAGQRTRADYKKQEAHHD